MKKLFKLKEWLTIAETAAHLSIVLDEPVSESDVLRLALDGHLTISVNFVNHAKARIGRFNLMADVVLTEIPNMHSIEKLFSAIGVRINNDDGQDGVIQFEDKLILLHGVFDLPLIGGEKLDIEHAYQNLTNGPSVTLENIDGAFVKSDENWYQLQESFDDNEYSSGSSAQLKNLKNYIAANDVDKDRAKQLLDKFEIDRKVFKEKEKANKEINNYYPAGGLPLDSVLVVRTKALSEFEESLNDKSKMERPLGTRERNTLLTLLAVACKEANLDYTKPAKTANLIEDIAIKMGLAIGNSTIEGHLKNIPNALESRLK